MKTHQSSVRCPFHDDAVASGAIKEAESGKWYFYCYVCDIADDYWALKARVEGRSVEDVLKEGNDNYKDNVGGIRRQPQYPTFEALLENWKANHKDCTVEEKNCYADPETGQSEFATIRYLPPEGSKKFLQAHRNGDGGWHMTAPKVKPLFNRTRIKTCANILVVEGEKCVRAFTKLNIEGWAATTNPGGSNGTGNVDWTPLKGKRCVIWHDNDEPGEKHCEKVKEILLDMHCVVSRVRVEELGLDPKDDIVDYLEDMPEGVESQILAINVVLQDAEPISQELALESRLNKILSGDYRHIPFLRMPTLSRMGNALLPGTVTTICGEPGAGKSFFVLEQFWRWILERNEKVALFMFEDDDAFHQMRILAQMSRRSELTDLDFCQEHPDLVRELFAQFKDVITQLSFSLTTAKSQQKTQTEIVDWVREQAEGDADIIIIDPITAAKASREPWVDDLKYMFAVKEIVERTGKRLLQLTHPRVGKAGQPGLSGVSGGAAHTRFAQTVIWLQNFDKAVEYKGAYEYDGLPYKQLFQIRKSRNGKGQGQHIAVNLNYDTLCFDEYGQVTE